MMAILTDPASSQQQKEAKFEELLNMERREILEILTPAQQAEVNKRIEARLAAQQTLRRRSDPRRTENEGMSSVQLGPSFLGASQKNGHSAAVTVIGKVLENEAKLSRP